MKINPSIIEEMTHPNADSQRILDSSAFLWLWAVGFAALIIAQLIAEWTLAIFSIANDVNVLRRSASSTQSAPVSDSGRTG